jgi:hypothetical protein
MSALGRGPPDSGHERLAAKSGTGHIGGERMIFGGPPREWLSQAI